MEIHELEARTGVRAKTIRYYEQAGVLPPPQRKPNGYREYDGNDVERLKFVAGARQLDFSLDDIAEILVGQMAKSTQKLCLAETAPLASPPQPPRFFRWESCPCQVCGYMDQTTC